MNHLDNMDFLIVLIIETNLETDIYGCLISLRMNHTLILWTNQTPGSDR